VRLAFAAPFALGVEAHDFRARLAPRLELCRQCRDRVPRARERGFRERVCEGELYRIVWASDVGRAGPLVFFGVAWRAGGSIFYASRIIRRTILSF
jgi:hypothetical protein